MTAKYFRLRDKHPTMVKLDKIFSLADELGISLIWGNQRVEVRDNDQALPPMYLEDLEDGWTVDQFPPVTEYKVTYENPAAIAVARKEHEEYMAKRAEEERLEKERRAAHELAERERKARELEEHERQLLVHLKAKYEG